MKTKSQLENELKEIKELESKEKAMSNSFRFGNGFEEWKSLCEKINKKTKSYNKSCREYNYSNGSSNKNCFIVVGV